MGIIFSKFEVKGYVKISSFNSVQENGLLNLTIRILSPIIYLIIINCLFNFVLPSFNYLTKDIWLIVPYYFLIRLVYIILVMNRFFIFDKVYFFIVSLVSSYISFFIYQEYLSKGDLFLPNKQEFLMQFWFIVIIFIYHFINNTQFKLTHTIKETREKKFIKRRLTKFQLCYGNIVNKEKNDVIRNLIYSIMIIEDFNRPYIFRLFEKIYPYSKTVGIMQTAKNKQTSDQESVKEGMIIIQNAFKQQIKYWNNNKNIMEKTKYEKGNNDEYFIRHAIISYNKCENYYNMVISVYDYISEFNSDL